MPSSPGRGKGPAGSTGQAPAKRSYHSPKREQQSAKTRQRIVDAGVELVHQFSEWDWKQLTYRAVGERAGVSERTVYRYFPSDEQLKQTVMQQLVREAGVELQDLKLGDFAETVAKVFRYLSTFAMAPTEAPEEPTFVSMDSQRRRALLDAVERATPAWSTDQRETAAAALDIFWNLPPFERLILTWGFDQEKAAGTVGWIIGLIEKAISEDNRPG